MSSTIPRLPADIVQLIIQTSLDFPVLPTLQATQARYRSLCRFALVDYTWADLARRELCREVVIQRVDKQSSLLGMLQPEGTWLGGLVESLALGVQEGWTKGPEPVVLWAPVLAALAAVTSLRELSLYLVSDVEQLGRYLPPSANVHTLCLKSCTFRPSPNVAPLVALRRLSLITPTSESLDALLSSSPSFAPNLTELVISRMYPPTTFPNPLAPAPATTTTTLASHLTTLLLDSLHLIPHQSSLLFPTPNLLRHLIITDASDLPSTVGRRLPALRTLSLFLRLHDTHILQPDDPQVWNDKALTPSLGLVRLGPATSLTVNPRERQARQAFEAALREGRPRVKVQELEYRIGARRTAAVLFQELDAVQGL